MSSAYEFKKATRQNLVRMKSCCLPIGWCFLTVLQYGQNEGNTQEGGEGWERWVVQSREARRALAEKGQRPPLQFTTHPQPRSSHPWERRRRSRWKRPRSGWRRQGGWRMWEGHCHHCQPNSWPRWLQRLGHLCWVRRSQPGGSSDWPWEAKPLKGIPPGW